MRKSGSMLLSVFIPGILLAFTIPLAVFFGSALTAGLSLSESVDSTAQQFFAERHPLFSAQILGLVPVVLATVLGWLLARKIDAHRSRVVAQAGLAGAATVLIWINVAFWPDYLPERTFRGFPHGLEFVIGPLFFAPPATLIAMTAAWFATRENVAT